MGAMAKSILKRIAAGMSRRRAWVQFAFLFVWLDPFLLRLHSVCGAAFHCYACPLATFACPVGILAGFSALHLFPFLVVGTLLAVGAVFGSLVCGWACPFGFLQDLLAKIPTPKLTLPGWAGYTRYAVLIAFVVVAPYFFGEDHPLFFCRLCPAGVLEAAVPSMVQAKLAGSPVTWPNAAKLAIFIGVMLAMFVSVRPWCVMFCPLGAIYGLMNRVSFFFLRIKPADCNACGACRKICPVSANPESRPNHSRCIRCLDCTRCRALALGHILQSRQDEAGPEAPRL